MSLIDWWSHANIRDQAVIVASVVGGAVGLCSGLLSTVLKGAMDVSSTRNRITYEALSARQSKLIDAQSQFLDDLTKAVWNWRYLSMRVTYYGALDGASDIYNDAVGQYRLSVWERLSDIRLCSSRSRRLLTEQSFVELKSFYEDVVIKFGNELQDAISEIDDTRRRFRLLELNNDLFHSITACIDNVLLLVGDDLKLSRKDKGRQKNGNGKSWT